MQEFNQDVYNNKIADYELRLIICKIYVLMYKFYIITNMISPTFRFNSQKDLASTRYKTF